MAWTATKNRPEIILSAGSSCGYLLSCLCGTDQSRGCIAMNQSFSSRHRRRHILNFVIIWQRFTRGQNWIRLTNSAGIFIGFCPSGVVHFANRPTNCLNLKMSVPIWTQSLPVRQFRLQLTAYSMAIRFSILRCGTSLRPAQLSGETLGVGDHNRVAKCPLSFAVNGDGNSLHARLNDSFFRST